MPLSVRAAKTRIANPESDDPTVVVVPEVYSPEHSNQVVAEGFLSYSLAGMNGMTDQQKRDRVTADALAWAAKVKENAAKAAPILTLTGQGAVIP
jgi:hypothetical protein